MPQTLTPNQEQQVLHFTAITFDARLRIALSSQQFTSTSLDARKRRATEWLQHYGKVVYNLMARKPIFATGYPKILKLMADNSIYYRELKDDLI